jgi:hypothetical protein
MKIHILAGVMHERSATLTLVVQWEHERLTSFDFFQGYCGRVVLSLTVFLVASDSY